MCSTVWRFGFGVFGKKGRRGGGVRGWADDVQSACAAEDQAEGEGLGGGFGGWEKVCCFLRRGDGVRGC